jgi:anti-sigma factor RsiW
MNACQQIRAQLAFYLDDELHHGDREEFVDHLANCADCRDICERERRLLEGIRASRPLYSAPAEMRSKVAQLFHRESQPYTASNKLRQNVQRALRPGVSSARGLKTARVLAFTAALGGVIFVSAWVLVARRNSETPLMPSEFAMMAVDAHLRHLRGQLPLEIVSDSAEQISKWFAGKVNFGLTLPDYQGASGQEKLYSLEGARLVGFKQDYAAYVAYKMRRSPITLVVTSNSVAMPAGGEEIISKGVTFHYDSINGQKVITWSDRGLTYALVSNLEERGQQSCLVCHAGTKDRDFIEGLKPR